MTYEEYKRKKKKSSSESDEDDEKLTPYQRYRKEKGLSIYPTITPSVKEQKTNNQPIKQLATEIVDNTPVQQAIKISSKDVKPEEQKPQSVLEEALAYHASMDDGVPMADLQKDPEEKKKDNRTWFQKGAFEDGYQFGDVTKTLLGTKTDAQVNLSAGALGLGEKAVDTAAAVAPYNLASEIQGNYSDPGAQAGATIGQMLASLFMGKDANYIQDQRNELAAQALAETKPAAEEFIKKDLYDEKKVAKWIVDNATIGGQINKLVGVDAQRDSILGEKADALVQSAGQLAAQYGLSLVGVPWFVTSSVSSFGSEAEGALGQGATLEEAVTSGAITAGAEILTEKLFGGDLFVKGAGFDELVEDLTMGIANKFARKAAQLGLNAVGEGSEEWLSQRIGQFGQWLTYNHDEQELLELLYSEESLNEALEAFLGGVALGGGMGAIKAVSARQTQSGTQGDVNAQDGNDQVAQETVTEPKPGTLEWVQEVIDLGAGKKTQKNTVQSNGNKYHLRDYSQEQKNDWKNSKRIVLYEGVEQFKNFIKNALTGKTQTNKKLYFGAVDSDLAAAISAKTGVDVEGYNLALGENEIRKINKDHGSEQTEAPRGQRAVTEADYLNIPNVVQSPDNITLSSKLYGGKPVIEFRKTNGNETTVVSAVVSDKRLDLFVQTTYVNKKRGSMATPESEHADSNTPEATGGTAPNDASLDGGRRGPKVASSNVSSDASNKSIPQIKPGVNTNSGKAAEVGNTADNTAVTNPSESVGAAPANPSVGAANQNFSGRAAYQDLLSDENSQRDRPGDVRPVEVPKVDGYGRNVSEFVGNAYGSEVVPDNFTSTIEELVQEGALGYDTKTNAESLHEAAEVIKKKGMASARNAITRNIANGKIGDTDIATAMLLFNQYAHKNGQQAQDSAAELFVDLQMMATQTGRDLQMFKMLRKMTPQGQLMAVTKNVDRYVQSVNKRRGRKNQVEVSVPTELTNEYMEAAQDAAVNDTPENQQRKLDAEQAIYEYAAANIPATLQEKWDAWRYLAMLGNPKTQIRNVMGNGLFRPFVEAKRYLGAAIESVFLEQDQRTKSVLGFSESDRALLDWARKDSRTTDTMQQMEYTATTGDAAVSEIGDRRQIFKTTAFEKARTGLNDIMSAEDMFFKRGAYSTALASFLKARGVTAQQLQDGSVDSATVNAARNYAVKEAMKATFNDQNAVSNFVANKLRYKGNNTFGKILNAAAEGILPFRRTPANIALRGLEYSPLGLGKTLLADTGKLRNGEITAAEYIDSVAAGLTGSAAMALGYALASGIFEGIRLVGNEDDEDEKRTGHKSYALEIGDVSIPVDWAAPAVLPLFMGANLYDSLNPESENVSTSVFTGILDACANTLEPMLELSCLSSLNDLITDARYAEQGRELYAIAASAATSYFMQGLPTLFGQVEQAFETEKKTIYADSSDPVISEVQQVLGRATQKIPGIDLSQTEKVDAWGRTEEKGVEERIFDAFINPANDSKLMETEADSEIKRLNRVQSENVSPPATAKVITYTDKDGNKHTNQRLTEKQYNTLRTVQGQAAARSLELLLQHEDYQALTDMQKAKAFNAVYDYARETGRAAAIEGYPGYTGEDKEIQGIPADTIIKKVVSAGITDAFSALTDSWRNGRESTDAITALEEAYYVYSKLSNTAQKQISEEAGGRLGYYLTAKKNGIATDTFIDLYKTFYSIDNGNGNASDKASKWSYELEKAREQGTITTAQKNALKEDMNFWQMIPAKTARFDELISSGLSVDNASYVDKLLADLLPEKGKTNVRTIQQVEAIAGSKLSEKDQKAVLEDTLDDKSFAKYLEIMKLGMDTDDYAASYRTYLDEKDIGGKGTKARIIAQFQDELDVSKGVAEKLYDIYAGAK